MPILPTTCSLDETRRVVLVHSVVTCKQSIRPRRQRTLGPWRCALGTVWAWFGMCQSP